jgi:leader peptidase (prepilin peptidase)/N-methyltransferase
VLIVVFLFGLFIGSFINVCIYRIPKRKSIVFPGSFCPNCLVPIKPYDNIPVLSYIIVGGKCRACKKPIPWRYPLVELLNGMLFILLYLKFGFSLVFLKFIIFTSLLVISTFTDFSHRIIPNVVSILGLVLGIILNYQNITDAVLGALIGATILWIFRQAGLLIRKQEMMGWGDIKLAVMIGAFLGLSNGILALFLGVVAGVAIWTMLILLKLKTRKEYIPFGAFLALGAIIATFYGSEIIYWYLSLFKSP